MVQSDPSVNEIIVHGIVVGAFQENCWVIGNRRTGDAICVDPGDQPDEILAMAKDMGVSIRYIANSHAHIDHVLGVRGVIEATGAKFLLHASDLELLRNTASSARRWTGTEIANPPDPDGFLADGDEIDVDGLKARVIHTPGHTTGSVSFYANGILFAGDTLFAGSIGRTDLQGGDFDTLIESIALLMRELPPETVVASGHGPATTLERERATNPFLGSLR